MDIIHPAEPARPKARAAAAAAARVFGIEGGDGTAAAARDELAQAAAAGAARSSMPDSAATSFFICALTSVSAIVFAILRSISSLLAILYGRAGATSSLLPLLFLLSLDSIIKFICEGVVWRFGSCVGPHLLLWFFAPICGKFEQIYLQIQANPLAYWAATSLSVPRAPPCLLVVFLALGATSFVYAPRRIYAKQMGLCAGTALSRLRGGGRRHNEECAAAAAGSGDLRLQISLV